MLKTFSILFVIPFLVLSLSVVGYAAYVADDNPDLPHPLKDESKGGDVRLEFCYLNIYWDNYHDTEGEDNCFGVFCRGGCCS